MAAGPGAGWNRAGANHDCHHFRRRLRGAGVSCGGKAPLVLIVGRLIDVFAEEISFHHAASAAFNIEAESTVLTARAERHRCWRRADFAEQ
jgi:hypothetical protein